MQDKTAKFPRSDETLPDGPWLDHLDPPYLARTYPSWACGVSTVEEAAGAFRQRGFAELAALRHDLQFDPVYFAEANPAWEGTDDLERYRSWLLEGIPQGRPGSPAAHLRFLGLALEAYPSSFPWQYYSRLRPQAGAHRWAALDDFCATGFEALSSELSFGLTAAELLLALGRMYSTKNDRLAIRAYELARSCGPLPALEQQHLGDAYLREGLWRQALDLYRGIVEDGKETAWTLRNLAKCAVKLEHWPALSDIAKSLRGRLGEGSLWHEAACETMDAIFGCYARRARTLMANDHYADADELLTGAVAELGELAASLDLGPTKRQVDIHGKVLLLSNDDDRESASRRVGEKILLLEQLGLAHHVVPFTAAEQLASELPSATAVILFRVPALPAVIRCIAAARRLGVPVYYDTDAVLRDWRTAPEISAFRGRITSVLYDELRFGVPLYRAAARLCEFGIAPTGRMAEAVRSLVRSQRCFVVKDTFPENLQSEHEPRQLDRGGLRLFLKVAALTFLDAATEAVVEQLLLLMQRRPEIELHVSGALHLDRQFDMLGDRIHHVGPGETTRSSLPVSDVNLSLRCATPDDEYHAEIGWCEAASAGVPSLLFIPAGLLPDLRNEENVVRTAEAAHWTTALERLLDDGALRSRIATQARKDAALLRSGAQSARSLEQALVAGRELGRTM